MSFAMPDASAIAPPFVASDLTKSAFQSIRQAGGAANIFNFNPNEAHINDVHNQLNSMHDDIGVTGFTSTIDDYIAQATALGPAGADTVTLLQQQKADVLQCYAPIGLDHFGDMTASIEETKGVIATQNAQVLSDLPSVANSASQYAAATSAMGEAPTICDSVKDLMASIGGAAKDIVSGVKDAMAGIAKAFSSVSSAAKSAISSALASLKSTFSGLFSGGTGIDTSGISAALADFKASATSFVNSAKTAIADGWHAATGVVYDAAKGVAGMIGDVASSIKTGLGDLKDMISEELGKLAGVKSYLKDFAAAMSLPSLNPCAKSAMKNVLEEKHSFAGTTFDPSLPVSATNKMDPMQQLIA